jgi:hypothetical protein
LPTSGIALGGVSHNKIQSQIVCSLTFSPAAAIHAGILSFTHRPSLHVSSTGAGTVGVVVTGSGSTVVVSDGHPIIVINAAAIIENLSKVMATPLRKFNKH